MCSIRPKPFQATEERDFVALAGRCDDDPNHVKISDLKEAVRIDIDMYAHRIGYGYSR